MRKTIVLLSLLLAAPIAAISQAPIEGLPGYPAPIFELTKPFEHPVTLPSQVLALLRADEANAGRFEVCRSRGNLPQIPPEWFVATEIKLADGEHPGMIVKAANTCLWDGEPGQKEGDFWVFRQAPTGYQLLFTAHAYALQVLNTHTGGYPDLCIYKSGGILTLTLTFYRFGEGKYLEDTDKFGVVYDYLQPG
jgi:hypothetical protein